MHLKNYQFYVGRHAKISVHFNLDKHKNKVKSSLLMCNVKYLNALH